MARDRKDMYLQALRRYAKARELYTLKLNPTSFTHLVDELGAYADPRQIHVLAELDLDGSLKDERGQIDSAAVKVLTVIRDTYGHDLHDLIGRPVDEDEKMMALACLLGRL